MGVCVDAKRCRVLKKIFGTVDYKPEQVANLRWIELAAIPGCGSQTIESIREWLSPHGLDIADIPDFIHSPSAKDGRIREAMVELHRRGFEIIFPKGV